ncbi:hypothetical protein Q8A67_025227 [Cirrhinus molitorella]|uniref:Uncharacterized protein n=1 Tax=Cirrhinus molitorella TaxID=172907 RepID=A0AA88NVT0_9TELE|nr:hypothetical protein Q8A67_025227 [Cirrhinus molitorella]
MVAAPSSTGSVCPVRLPYNLCQEQSVGDLSVSGGVQPSGRCEVLCEVVTVGHRQQLRSSTQGCVSRGVTASEGLQKVL